MKSWFLLLYNRLMNQDPSKKIDQFFSSGRRLAYKKNDLILQPEIEPSGVFYIKKGLVKMTAISAGGEEVVINTFKSGAFFPIGWMLNDTPNSYFYQAGEESEVFKMPKTEVRKFLESEPDILFDLMKRIYKGLDGYFMRMQYLMAGNAYSRLITELIILAKRFGQKTKGSDQILLKTTEKDLAAQTGITRETVSREFKKLIDKNIISFQTEHLIIKSLGDLEKELS